MIKKEARVKQIENSLILDISNDFVNIEDLKIEDLIKTEKSKEKRVDGFGIMENIHSFEEDKEEYKEF